MDGVLFIIWIVAIIAALIMFRLGVDSRDDSTDSASPTAHPS